MNILQIQFSQAYSGYYKASYIFKYLIEVSKK